MTLTSRPVIPQVLVLRSLVVALVFVGVSAVSCIFSKAEVSFSVVTPSGLPDTATWVEVSAIAGGCPSAEQVVSGSVPGATGAHVAFRLDDAAPPSFGELPKGKYGFLASIRNESCAVVAAGCASAEIPRDAIRIQTALVTNGSQSGCKSGTSCAFGRCVPSVDPANSAAGRNCSMQLLGAGPLGPPLAPSDIRVSAPTIVASPSGFLIAYREFDATAGVSKYTIVPIDQGGGIGKLGEGTLNNRCAGSDESDGVGLAMGTNGGVLVLARRPCGASPAGIEVYSLDAKGQVGQSGVTEGATAEVTLSPTRSVAALSDGSYLLAYRFNGQARIAKLNGLGLQGTGTVIADQSSDVWISASTDAIAVLTSVPTKEETGDAATGDSNLELTLTSSRTDLSKFPTPTRLDGSSGAIAILGGRAYVSRKSDSPGRVADVSAYDLGSSAEAASEAISTTHATGITVHTDVALSKNRAFFAIGQPGSVSVVVYDNATTRPSFLRDIYLPNDSRVPTFVNRYRDGYVSIAATDTHVAVAWTTTQILAGNDVVGGYAVYACSTP